MENYNSDTGGNAPIIYIDTMISLIEFNVTKDCEPEDLEKMIQKGVTALMEDACNSTE